MRNSRFVWCASCTLSRFVWCGQALKGTLTATQLVPYHQIGDDPGTKKQGYALPVATGRDLTYRLRLDDGTAAGEGVGVLHESKGIEEVEGSGVDSEAIGGAGITVDGGGDASSLGRREGDGGGGEGGGDEKLHDVYFTDILLGIVEGSQVTKYW